LKDLKQQNRSVAEPRREHLTFPHLWTKRSPSLGMCFVTSDKWLFTTRTLHFSNPAAEWKKTLPGQTSGSRIRRSCWTWKTLHARRKKKVAEFLAPDGNQTRSASLPTRC